MKSRIRSQSFDKPRVIIILLVVAKVLFVMISISLFAAACTRRPVQKDVVINEPPQRSTNRDEEIRNSPHTDQAPIDLQFIDTTIRMHLAAIDAEQLVATRAEHKELKQFARSRVAEQQREIAALRQFRSAWFGDPDQAVRVDLPGVRDALEAVDAEKLDPLKEQGFDVEFVKQMIWHDKAVLVFANEMLNASTRAELKDAARSLINEKDSELAQTEKWEKDWQKGK